ncbi:MAG: XdhC family protein [Bacteroidetes bacterium]|nr:XdhC family protein [Bacteroidota bacterium]
MKEIKAIINAYDKIDRNSVKAALATVVNVEGSSYRRMGARMLVMDDGKWVGGISGGCLEGDALIKARTAIVRSVSTITTYDTREDDPYQIGVGLGCNGVIEVLFTPLDFNDKNNPVEILKNGIQSQRQTIVLLSITNLKGAWRGIKPGDTILYNESKSLDVFGEKDFKLILQEKIERQIALNKSSLDHFELPDGKDIDVFIELIPPEIHVALMGHQYDIYSFAAIAKELGWQVTIIANPLKINHSFTINIDRILPHDKFNELKIDGLTAIILMSHDFKTDKLNLKKALQTNCVYIGMLGPRVRAEKIFRELEEEGFPISEKDRARIYSPAGLDIGALSPEEIALSLIAEIRAVFSEREGGFLKLRTSAIHERE